MLVNQELIEKTIELREQKNDSVKEFAVRYKGTPIDEWNKFETYTEENFQKVYGHPIVDGVKLKFRYVTLYLNGRHSNK